MDEVIGEDMRVCRVNTNMVRNREGWRERIRETRPTYMGK